MRPFLTLKPSEINIRRQGAETQTVNLSVLSNRNASVSGRDAAFVCQDHTSQIPARILRREKYIELIHCLYHQVDTTFLS